MKDTWVGTYDDFPLAREARGYMHADDDEKPQWDISGAGDPDDGVWDSTEWFPLSGANAAGRYAFDADRCGELPERGCSAARSSARSS